MAYVFGMEGVPVFEMLFILMLLMLVGLIFVLLEIRKLVNLIAKEKTDISRFEEDLSKFEHGGGKNPSTELVNYVKSARESGISDDQIQNSLSSKGWETKHISNLFDKINKNF